MLELDSLEPTAASKFGKKFRRRKTPKTATPDVTEAPHVEATITQSKVENILRRPETNTEQFEEEEELPLYKSKIKWMNDKNNTEDVDANTLETNLKDIDRSLEVAMVESREGVNNVDYTDAEATTMAVEETTESPEDDIIPIYLRIPKSKKCRKFCLTVSVEVSRAGRQLKPTCRKSLLCNSG